MTVLLYLLFNNAAKPKSLNIYVITYTYLLLNFWWWKWWKHYHTCKYDFIPHIVLVLENTQSESPSPTALTSLKKLAEMQILGPHSILTEPEILQYRCVLTSPSDDSTGLSSLKTTGLEEVKIFPKKAMRTWLEAQLERSCLNVGETESCPVAMPSVLILMTQFMAEPRVIFH